MPTARRYVFRNDGEGNRVDCRINVALELAIADRTAEALNLLSGVKPAVNLRDKELSALFFQAHAIAKLKSQQVDEAFEAFEHALACARALDDPRLCARILNNYGTAEAISGNVELAIAHLEEALGEWARLSAYAPLGVLSLAQATFAGGYLDRTRLLLHEYYAIEGQGPIALSCSGLLLVASAVAIPTAIMLEDAALLRMSSESSFVDLAFALQDQSLLGPLVEAFCMLFEHEKRRDSHDALLARFTDSVQSMDESLSLGIRIARLGSARHLLRIDALMSRQCSGNSKVLKAYKVLFDSFIAARRSMPGLSKELARKAAGEFCRAGRPLQQAVALQASGLSLEADFIRVGCGVRTVLSRPNWGGAPISRHLTEALTPREAEIAKLVARGLTNRKIAALLGVSHRTVQHHCESIFCKLGIRSRWQLSEASNGDIRHAN